MFDWFKRTKANPVQSNTRDKEPQADSQVTNKRTPAAAYQADPVFNRCVNILVDNSAEVIFRPVKKIGSITAQATGEYSKTDLDRLLSIKPNPYQDANTFWRLMEMDFWMGGRCFATWDGESLYHVPEADVAVYQGVNSIIDHFEVNGKKLSTNEVLFIKDNAYRAAVGSSAIGANSRYKAAEEDIIRKSKLSSFKERYLDNGTLLGLILETESVLSKSFKDKILDSININYNSKSGKFMNSAIILDGGLKAKSTAQIDLSQLGIQEDKKQHNDAICTQMGVPPILLEGGNNANIRPNIELMFSLTILPNLKKFTGQLSAFFGYSFELITSDVFALSPDTQKEADRVTKLVNNGLITGDEGRLQLGYKALNLPETTKIRIPQNVQGSNSGVSGQEGGRPPNEDK